MQHTREHDQLLIEILGESPDPQAGLSRSRIAACAQCHELVEDVATLQELLDDAGRYERETIAEALRLPTASARSNGSSPATPAQRTPARGRARRPILRLVAALAAAVLLFLGLQRMLIDPRVRPGDPADDPVRLGAGSLQCDRPIGEVGEYSPFTWKAPLVPGGGFQILIYGNTPGSRRTSERALFESPRLETHEWKAPRDVEATWPDAIVWELRVFSPAGAPRSRFAEASRH